MCLGFKNAICPEHRDMGVVGIPLEEDPYEHHEDDAQPRRFDDDFGGLERRTAS